MQKSFLTRPLTAAVSAAFLLLAGCGGGGGDDGGSAPTGSARFSEAVAGCALNTQKQFARAYLNEVYLWYREIPVVNAAAYDNLPDYFDALLVKSKDRFSTVLPVAQAEEMLNVALPRADGVDPGSVLQSHTGDVSHRVLTTAGGTKVGYVRFADHSIGTQDDLIATFTDLKNQAVQDVILDLRENTGGYLYVAASTASMIAGPGSNGLVFEHLKYNDKRPSLTFKFSGQVQYPEASSPVGTPLPQLGLRRVFVLTSANTCSASEAIINGLRGIDGLGGNSMQVIRLGDTTCGKPYGFSQKNNCGYAYFPIEFQGSNAKGFGDYTSGFQPQCRIPDTSTLAQRGGASDPVYQGALTYIDTNDCPAGTRDAAVLSAGGLGRVLGTGTANSGEGRGRPAWTGRLLTPEQQPN